MNDKPLTYEEKKAMGWAVTGLIDDTIKDLQEKINKLCEQRNALSDKVAALNKEMEPLVIKRNLLQTAREKLTW